ncbi:MAG TPA: hypothetical protein VF761_07125 [Gemmatimonadaceae bacterium]
MNHASPRNRRQRWTTVLFAAIALLASAAAWMTCGGSARPNHAVRDAHLARVVAAMYVPTGAPRALVVFFGNDIGFWQPHRELAGDLAADGYAVVGVDIRPLFASLPARLPARDSACAAAIADLVARSRRELSIADAPLVIAGHSLGAELALWTGAHVALPRMAGIVALSPGSRSHLDVSASDLLQREPTGPESFAVAEVMRVLRDRATTVAIVRGAHDRFGSADSALLANGGPHTRRFEIALAGHSLRHLTLARPVIEDALSWVLAGGGVEDRAAAQARLSAP